MSDHELIENARANEALMEKLYQLEVALLSVYSFKDLFDTLLSRIETDFDIPHAWISILEDTEIASMVSDARLDQRMGIHVQVVPENAFREFIIQPFEPVLVNEDMSALADLHPGNWVDDHGSLAMTPLLLEERIIGSINLADRDAGRFDPELDTAFLRLLAVKVSLCLANVTNRERLMRLATRDRVTGLRNRSDMGEILHGEYSRAIRYVTPLSVMFIDIDQFRKVNDQFGHHQGDDFLRHVADGLLEVLRLEDFVFRVAGDQFVVLLPGQDRAAAARVGERLNDWFKKHPARLEQDKGLKHHDVLLSIGIADSIEGGIEDADELLERADDRTYEVKRRLYGNSTD
jgi:diguanylate cyclase (GGDEF)-like protein